MKATGIVRRIDDLGRVVIPKEIRRTMRIREGDPLEIFTDTDGEVVFKKYSPVGEMSPFAIQYADVMSRACSLPVLICDRDHVVAAAGVSKKEFTERRISAQLEEAMEQRQTHVAKAGDQKRLQPVESIDRYAGVMCPIVAAGDVTGAVCMLLPGKRRRPYRGRRQAGPGSRRLPREANGRIKQGALSVNCGKGVFPRRPLFRSFLSIGIKSRPPQKRTRPPNRKLYGAATAAMGSSVMPVRP